MTADPVGVIVVDCHAYDWHDPEEMGGRTLAHVAEQYGVLIEHLADHDLSSWASWYRVEGPRSHLVALMAGEYCGGEVEAEELVAAYLED